MNQIPALSAARRLASELELPSWKGTVLVAHRGSGDVLVVAAKAQWLRGHRLPLRYCGYEVEAGDQVEACAQ